MDSENHMQNQSEYLKGKCLTMCPFSEVKLRLRENLIHKLEKRVIRGQRTEYADQQHMIKEYSRSSAGHQIYPSDVRPFPILLKTVKYLFSVVCSYEDVSWREIYDFVDNRLRAVRQDIIVQDITAKELVNIFVPAARFYIYSYYRLCDNECGEFDPHLNIQQLRELLLTLLPIINEHSNLPVKPISNFGFASNHYSKEIELCREMATLIVSEANLTNSSRDSQASTTEATSLFNPETDANCSSDGDDDESEEEFVNYKKMDDDIMHEQYSLYEEAIALHLIINLGRSEPVRDVLVMPKHMRFGEVVRPVIRASMAWLEGNHIPFIRLATTLTPILSMALLIRLNEIQRHVLGVSSVAYNSSVLCYKVKDLRQNLLFSSEESLRKACLYYGLSTSSDGVHFLKANFKWDVPMLAPEKAEWVEKKINKWPVSDLLLGGPNLIRNL